MTFQEELNLVLIGFALGVVASLVGSLVTAGINHFYWRKRDREIRDKELRWVLGRSAWLSFVKTDTSMTTVLDDLSEFGVSSGGGDSIQLDKDFFLGIVEGLIEGEKEQ